MSSSGMRKHEFYLRPDVMDIILETSSERDVTNNKALDLIVREWQESKEIEPTSLCSDTIELSEIADSLKDVDARLDLIEFCLTDLLKALLRKLQLLRL